MKRSPRPWSSGAGIWPTALGVLVSVTAVGLGLRFGLAGLAGTIAIGLFALFASAAIIASRRAAEGCGMPPQDPLRPAPDSAERRAPRPS